MSNILTVGDILELRCGEAYAYVSYAGKHRWLGDAVWVVARVFAERPPGWETVFRNDGYFVFFAAHSALRQRVAKKVGFSPDAMKPIGDRVRTRGSRDKSGRVTSWVLTDGTVQEPRRDEDLSEAERALPIGVIWNYPLLCERLLAGMRPDADTGLS